LKYAMTFFLVSVFSSTATWAEDVAIIVGGGPYARGSQVSIERNTLWIKNIIEQKSGFKETYLYYGGGSTSEPDVMTRQDAGQGELPMDPLAHVFGEEVQNREHYRKTNIPGVIGSTQVDDLKNRLNKIFASLQPGDTLLFIFQGHGGYDDSGQQDNTLKLWHATRLHVSELNALFNDISKDVRIVFVFPQCYSGAFADLMYANPGDHTVLSKQNRCGFLSQRGDRQAEGCTASINTADYRDYSTYFFAALDGETRTGKPLAENPDKNGDGVVTFREAHLYALKFGMSTDLSRSTSEVYLERWVPWYARWATSGTLEENSYSRIAESLANRIGMNTENTAGLSRVLRHRADLKQRQRALKQERDKLEAEEKGLQKKIRYSLTDRWPQLSYPYTNNYINLMQLHGKEVNRAASTNPQYRQLKIAQARLVAIEDELLVLLRKDAQLEKLYRMRKLSRIRSLFDRLADDEEKRAYARLVQCEQTALR